MIAVDSSVVVAAFAPWHEAHAIAHEALTQEAHGVAHVALETYSTLTRLPDPFRAPATVVATFLERRFGDRWLHPAASTVLRLPRRLADLSITGGAVYDALVACTAADHGATLCTLDRRAERVYQRIGVTYEMLGAA